MPAVAHWLGFAYCVTQYTVLLVGAARRLSAVEAVNNKLESLGGILLVSFPYARKSVGLTGRHAARIM